MAVRAVRKPIRPVTAKKPGKPKSSISILTRLRKKILLSNSKAEKQLYLKRLAEVKRNLASQKKKAT